MGLTRFDVCSGDRVRACSCARSVHNVVRSDASPWVARFNPLVMDGRCGDWKHQPLVATTPEDRL